MIELDRLKQAEERFFSFFDLNPPYEKYSIIDNRDCYWTAKEAGQHILIKFRAKDPNVTNSYGCDNIHRYRKGKGGYYEKDGVVMFRVTYSIKEVNYSYFRVLLDENYIDEYDNFLECIPLAAAQS